MPLPTLKKQNRTALHPYPNSSPSSLVPRRQGDRCEHTHPRPQPFQHSIHSGIAPQAPSALAPVSPSSPRRRRTAAAIGEDRRPTRAAPTPSVSCRTIGADSERGGGLRHPPADMSPSPQTLYHPTDQHHPAVAMVMPLQMTRNPPHSVPHAHHPAAHSPGSDSLDDVGKG